MASEMSCAFKKIIQWGGGKKREGGRERERERKKKKTVSVHFRCAMFSLLDFLTYEDGTDRLSRNAGKKLPIYAV